MAGRGLGSLERHLRYGAQLLLVAFAYVVAANLGRLAASYGIVTAVWPPSGVALAALLLGGLRLWPGVALGVLVTVGVNGQPAPLPIQLPPGAILAMMVGNTLEPVVGALLLRRFSRGSGRFDTLREVTAFLIFPILAGATISATVGASTLLAIGAVSTAEWPNTWWTWWVGNALGIIVVTPAITTWLTPPWPRLAHARVFELAALLLLGVLSASHAVFGMFPAVPRATREAYLMFPVLVWAALRFGPRGAATAVFAVSTVALTSTAMRSGTFSNPDLALAVLRLQVFIGVMSATILLLAASIAERRRACEELNELRIHLEDLVQRRTSDLEASNRDLESFAFKVSHDLRAPLRAVSGFTTILQEEYAARLPPEARVLLDRASIGAHRMATLMDALLEYARVGRSRLQVRDVDVAELVVSVVAEVTASLGDREIQVVVGALPACRADPVLLRQVFVNLLENAVKYTRTRPDAHVFVGADVVEGMQAYYVRDNGVGFDMQRVGQLFRVFSRLHGEAFEGTGIGLAIVQRIVDQHGGRVWAEGVPDEGATFWFTLRCEAGAQK